MFNFISIMLYNTPYILMYALISNINYLFNDWSYAYMIQVAQVAVRASLQSSGQNCAGAERYYVHRDIYNDFVAQVVKIVKSVTAVGMLCRNSKTYVS